jgi:ATP-dependent helicase/DNAse subunit B
MGRRIFAGDVNVDPYRKGAETACDFCDYRGICRIDPWTHRFRVLTKNSSTSTADGPAHQHEPDYGQPAPRD